MDTPTALRLAMALARANLDWAEPPRPGDLVVERSWMHRPDPDGIGWLIGHGDAPYHKDDPLDGSVPMREVWDVLPLNPAAKLQTDGYQRWENAQFLKVPAHVIERVGLERPGAIRDLIAA